MKLSVIIVSYNVKYFLEQCLCSVRSAIRESRLQAEVLVIDNVSSDGTIEYLSPLFPEMQFITNESNEGFAKANNRALRQAKGDFILFLNPDTLISADTLLYCLRFFDTQPLAGAVGVKMLDGSGRYLPESKRGFPTPWVSFCKMSGLTRIFPHSALFSRYYLGNLNENSLQQVDALAGAFMLIRKETLEKTGGFDERFFMYAEDIDLSYRIIQAGYQNFYIPDAPIIHFKGESTQKDRDYVNRFYGAMLQFVDKHYASSGFSSQLLKKAIRLRAWWAGWKKAKKAEKAPISGEIRQKIVEMAQNSTKIGIKEKDGLRFCVIGGEYGIGQLISQMEEHSGYHYYIYHQNSGAIISSRSNESRGEVIPL